MNKYETGQSVPSDELFQPTTPVEPTTTKLTFNPEKLEEYTKQILEAKQQGGKPFAGEDLLGR